MSEEDIRGLLKRNLELAEDNNRLLHAMRRRAVWGGIFKFVWWFAILFLIPAIAYYVYLAPYLPGILNTYQQFQGVVKEAQDIKGNIAANNPLADLIKMYEEYKASQAQ